MPRPHHDPYSTPISRVETELPPPTHQPKRVLILGLLSCLLGVLAIGEMIYSLFHDRLSVNLVFFLLPTGIGLLRGKESSRRWAIFWCYFGYLFCGVLTVALIANPEKTYVNRGGQMVHGEGAIPYLIAITTGLLFGTIVTHLLLRSRTTKAYCSRHYTKNPP